MEIKFEGEFKITPPLAPHHQKYLYFFSRSRHVKRDEALAESISADWIRESVGLPVGKEGAYCIKEVNPSDPSVLEYNEPPEGQPGLWCGWIPTNDGTAIIWDENDSFYEYTAWLQYLIATFLKPWGYTLNGEIHFDNGEVRFNTGTLKVVDNQVAKIIPFDCPEAWEGYAVPQRGSHEWFYMWASAKAHLKNQYPGWYDNILGYTDYMGPSETEWFHNFRIKDFPHLEERVYFDVPCSEQYRSNPQQYANEGPE